MGKRRFDHEDDEALLQFLLLDFQMEKLAPLPLIAVAHRFYPSKRQLLYEFFLHSSHPGCLHALG